MKLLLVGPYPPPHGGVSVHVAQARAELRRAGVPCRILNIDPLAPVSPCYIVIRNSLDLVLELWRYARDGWTPHLHTNGHNFKSWVLALLCGLAGRFAPARLLT
ncbi:MAG: glycosyl transferase family 1, partial [Gammaproteobacteria bacterium]